MKTPRRNEVESYRSRYPAGTRICCDSMSDDPRPVPSGTIRLRNTLLECEGKFLVSYNDCPEIRELWDVPGIYIEEITRMNNLALRYESGAEYHEVFISNYDTSERRNANRQLSFLDDDEEGI